MRIKNAIPLCDILFTFLLVFVSITMLLKVKVESDNASYQQQNAVFLIVLNWEGNADLDLWSKDPQNRIVSFHRREGGEGSLFSLNRDCLGSATTEIGENGEPVSKINEEIIAIRGTFTGEYIVNVHGYNMKGQTSAAATVKLVQNKPYKILIEKKKTIETNGQEETFFRFSVDKDGKITDLNELPTSLTQDKDQQ